MELAKSSQKIGSRLGGNQRDIGRCEPTYQEKQWYWIWKSRLETWSGFLAEKAPCESTSTNSFHADLYYCWQQSKSHQQLFHFHISFLHTPLRKKDGRPLPLAGSPLSNLTSVWGFPQQMFPVVGQSMSSTAQSLLRETEPASGKPAFLRLKTLQKS